MTSSDIAPARLALTVSGQVQGVGFRPFVYRIALDHGLVGSVRNTPQGVRIEVQGPPESLEGFARDLEARQPPLARIVSVLREDMPPSGEPEAAFEILHSSAGEGHNVLISPDTATCADCLAEVFAPDDRRHLYPFTNCTNCGPRYTITRSIPYDRPVTSMACFPMCGRCRAEYENPLDRRFHAQPNACPECGPRVWLTNHEGEERASGTEALELLAGELLDGRIAAIKGLGGFHLSCLAWGANGAAAIAELRRRKNRQHKPLALMVPDVATARRFVAVDEASESLLTGAERPIVLCPPLKDGAEGIASGIAAGIAPGIAPDTDQLGVMLPYTPLHHVLLALISRRIEAMGQEERILPALVMTSGNTSGEPICLGNREALSRLAHIADCFLFHDRDILIRTDDSVVRPLPATCGEGRTSELQFFRRARGYTPRPVFLQDVKDAPPVLGLGPELKNTLCLTKGDQAFVSQHIGDLENIETLGFFREIIAHLQTILQTRPVALVRDLHPDYLSSRHAMEQDELPVLELQHHYAHIHAVLAEHRHAGPALGLALDGTGLGEDGTLWGGELLYVDTATLSHHRMGRFQHLHLPGGESAIREPWRIARGILHQLGRGAGKRPWPWLDDPQLARMSDMLPQLLDKGVNAPVTSSCGRLFDAVAAMLGLARSITYEGQAAIVLEAAQDGAETGAYECPFSKEGDISLLQTRALFVQALDDWENGAAPGAVSRRFHRGLIRGLAGWAAAAAEETGVRAVALSGGVLQNRTLRTELPPALLERGLTPLCHIEVPPNDGCISLGQAAWARLHLAGRNKEES